MSKTLMMSDNYYWDSTNIIVKDAGDSRYRNVGNALHDVDWGLSDYVTGIGTTEGAAGAEIAISFNHTFKAPPVVICTVYGTRTGDYWGNKGYNYGDAVTSVKNGSVTTTGFTAILHSMSQADGDGVMSDVRVAWMAVSKMTYPVASSGDGYKLYNTDSDLVLWDIDSIGFQSAQSQFAVNKLGSEIIPPLIIASSTAYMRIGPQVQAPRGDQTDYAYEVEVFTIKFEDLTFRKFKSPPVVLTWVTDSDRTPGSGTVRRGAALCSGIVRSVSTTQAEVAVAHSTQRPHGSILYFIIIGEENR